LNAAEESYLQMAPLGYEGADAHQWASVVMSCLRIASNVGEAKDGADKRIEPSAEAKKGRGDRYVI